MRANDGSSRLDEAGLTPQRLGRLRSRLLAWYDESPRGAAAQDFPWRTARDPYLALVAAVCAQQTQMSRVLEIYARWVQAFPDLKAAAGASNAEVLRVWGRGGYPRRALAIRDAARIALDEHGGALPREPGALLALPGVGPFTAAIVRCFGFGDDAVAVDTNIVRVVGRLVFGDLQPARETAARDIEAAAARLLRPGTAARWNPALMDYGARVCAPRPRCGECVVASLCRARPRFEAGERAEPVRAQGAFEGSDRQWRGRILERLRAGDGTFHVKHLVAALAADEGEAGRVRTNLDALVAEGLAWSDGERCGLGDGGR